MTLDEMEQLARFIVDLNRHEKPNQGHTATDLARALLLVMPVVRAADRIRDGRYSIRAELGRKDRLAFDEFNSVVDDLRAALAGQEGR